MPAVDEWRDTGGIRTVPTQLPPAPRSDGGGGDAPADSGSGRHAAAALHPRQPIHAKAHSAAMTAKQGARYRPRPFAAPTKAHPTAALTARLANYRIHTQPGPAHPGHKRPQTTRHVSRGRANETLSHAIGRMLRQNKYSPEQIAGQVHRWHPDWTRRQADRLVATELLDLGHGGLASWLEDKAGRALHDIVHQPADTVRLYYGLTTLSARDFGSRAGYELGLVSKKRMLSDIENDRRYVRHLITNRLDILRHPLRDPFKTIDLLDYLREELSREPSEL